MGLIVVDGIATAIRIIAVNLPHDSSIAAVVSPAVVDRLIVTAVRIRAVSLGHDRSSATAPLRLVVVNPASTAGGVPAVVPVLQKEIPAISATDKSPVVVVESSTTASM